MGSLFHYSDRRETSLSLSVWQDGVVEAMRSVPYDGQRYYSIKDRANCADKSSQYRLTVEEVLTEYVERGESEADSGDLRERVLAVLRRDDVEAGEH